MAVMFALTHPYFFQFLIWSVTYILNSFQSLVLNNLTVDLLLLLHTVANKGPSSQSYGFSSSRVWM